MIIRTNPKDTIEHYFTPSNIIQCYLTQKRIKLRIFSLTSDYII
nr:MAG TPA: hypothetical protein [Caudoviricetes sp.]